MSMRRHPELPALTAECAEGQHDECPRIVATRAREIDEVGCSCDCHPFRYDASGGGEDDDGPWLDGSDDDEDGGPVNAPLA